MEENPDPYQIQSFSDDPIPLTLTPAPNNTNNPISNTHGDSHPIYDAKISIRSKLKYLEKIKSKLKPFPNRYLMFKNSVFGPWMDLNNCSNDSHLLNYVLHHQVVVKEFSADNPPLLFKISNHYLHFGREEFCLVTGFRCGDITEHVSDKIGYIDRLFWDHAKKQRKNVKVRELWAIINNDKQWCELDDEDAVKLCLVFVLEIVFMGLEEFYNVPLHILSLADDFFAWNSFPWGEYMWRYFYKRTLNVVRNHVEKKDPEKMLTYNLNGFVWALKIWILETYPRSTRWWVKKANGIPRCLSWSKFSQFNKTDYESLFGQDSIPNLVLLPTPTEQKADWFVRSQYYFKGEEAPFIQSVGPTVLPQTNPSQRSDCNAVLIDSNLKVDSTMPEASTNILRNFASSISDLDSKILGTVDVLCEQVIGFCPGMKGRISELKSDLIDTVTSALLKFEEKVDDTKAAADVNCKSNNVEDSLVETDDGVGDTDLNLVDCVVVDCEHLDAKQHSAPSSLDYLVYATGIERPPSPIFKSPRDHRYAEAAEETSGTDDDFMDTEDHPSQYCLDDLKLGVEADFENSQPTRDVTQKETEPVDKYVDEKVVSSVEALELVNENNDFDTLLKDGTMNLDTLIANVTKSANPSLQHIKAGDVNIVTGDGKPNLDEVFENIGRIKKPGYFQKLPYVKQRPTTPQVKKKRKRIADLVPIGFSVARDHEVQPSQQSIQPFREVLRRHCKSHPSKVTIPAYMKSFLKNKEVRKQLYKLPWVKYGMVVDEQFWLALLCLDENKSGWMLDDHLNAWIDLLWHFRPKNANWAIVGPHFCPAILSGQMPLFYAGKRRYPVSWADVDKVYIPLNHPKTHWALGELELRTGLIKVYDSMPPRKRNKKLPLKETRDWWINLRDIFSKQLPGYLERSGVLKSKGLEFRSYKVKFEFEESVPFQATVYGDCGIWVCILLFRLTHGLPLVFGDPLETTLAYRERMLAYFWNIRLVTTTVNVRKNSMLNVM